LANRPALRARFDVLLEVAQRYATIREEQARWFTLGWPLLRRAVLRLGEGMHAVGALGRADDVFAFLSRGRELDPLSPFIHALAGTAYYTIGQFDEAEQATRLALELQPDYLLGLWTRGLALCGLNRNEEGIALLERATVLSRAPIFVGVLGVGYARSGRTEDARRLLGELEDRASRGEYVPAFARLAINIGLGDVPAIRSCLAASLAESTPPYSIRVTSGVFLDEFRSDPEIGRLFDQLFHYDRLGSS